MKPSYSLFFRKCQDDETYDGCIARSYMKAFEETCQCLPFQLQFMKKVEVLEFLYYIFNHIGLNMSSKKKECVRNIVIDDSGCLPPCSGLFVTSYQENFISDLTDYMSKKPYFYDMNTKLKGRLKSLLIIHM